MKRTLSSHQQPATSRGQSSNRVVKRSHTRSQAEEVHDELREIHVHLHLRQPPKGEEAADDALASFTYNPSRFLEYYNLTPGGGEANSLLGRVYRRALLSLAKESPPQEGQQRLRVDQRVLHLHVGAYSQTENPQYVHENAVAVLCSVLKGESTRESLLATVEPQDVYRAILLMEELVCDMTAPLPGSLAALIDAGGVGI